MGFLDRLFGRKDNQPKVEKRTPLNMRVGDMVNYDLIDYQVVGLIKYNHGGYTWIAYQLDGEGERIWLSAEQDDTLELGIYRSINIDLGDQPPRKINYQGKVYILDESGEATITEVSGEAGAQPGQRVKYWEFEDESGDMALSVEKWGGDIEVSHGYFIHPREIKIMAGS